MIWNTKMIHHLYLDSRFFRDIFCCQYRLYQKLFWLIFTFLFVSFRECSFCWLNFRVVCWFYWYYRCWGHFDLNKTLVFDCWFQNQRKIYYKNCQNSCMSVVIHCSSNFDTPTIHFYNWKSHRIYIIKLICLCCCYVTPIFTLELIILLCN